MLFFFLSLSLFLICLFVMFPFCALQRPLLINYNAGILMTNGMLWNIHKIARYGDTYMILDRHKLKFSGNLLIEKVNVSVKFVSHFFRWKIIKIDLNICWNWNFAINADIIGAPRFMKFPEIIKTNKLCYKTNKQTRNERKKYWSDQVHRLKFRIREFIVIHVNNIELRRLCQEHITKFE